MLSRPKTNTVGGYGHARHERPRAGRADTGGGRKAGGGAGELRNMN